MAEQFDESTFLWAMMNRAADVRTFSGIFLSDWLHDAPLRPIFDHIVKFTKKHGVTPGEKTIQELLTKQYGDKVFKARYENKLKKITEMKVEISFVLYTMDLAKEVAISRSFQERISSQKFMKMLQDNSGTELLQEIEKWRVSFMGKNEDLHLTFVDALDKLQNSCSFFKKNFKAECGIDVVDRWTDGGLRPTDLGMWLAPTKSGKTSTMIYTAHHMAIKNDLKVWFISNEMSMDRITEKFLARITGMNISGIMEDPSEALITKGIKYIRDNPVHKNLMLSFVNRDASTDDLEAQLNRYETIWNWKPQVIILDYMERMKPNTKGFTREKSWTYYGEISKDLTRLAKSHNLVIWTAIQTNRGGLNSQEISGEQAQGSIQHLQEATAVISLHQPGGIEGDKQVIEYKPIYTRNSRGGEKPVKLEVDLGTMNISDVEYIPEEVEREEEPPPPTKYKKKSKFRPQSL